MQCVLYPELIPGTPLEVHLVGVGSASRLADCNGEAETLRAVLKLCGKT